MSSNQVSIREAVARVYNPDREFDNVTVHEKLISDTIEDTSGNPYIVSNENGDEVVLNALRVTGGLIVNTLTDTDGNPYLREGFANDGLSGRLKSEHRIYVSKHGRDTNDGSSPDRAFLTIRAACQAAERRPATTIFVESGNYYEQTPIFVDSTVSIVGDSLRTVFLHSRALEVGPVLRAKALLQGIARNIVTPGSRFAEDATTNPGGFHHAADTLHSNRAFLQYQVLRWVDENYPNLLDATRKDLCYRDVGFLVDAVVYDLRHGGYTSSLTAAEKYVDGMKSVLLPGQGNVPTVEPTAYAVSYLSTMCEGALTQILSFSDTDENAVQTVQSLVDLFVSFVDDPDNTIPSSVTNPGGYGVAAEVLQRNRLFIQVESSRDTLFNHASRLVRYREFGLLVDALVLDMQKGGTEKTIQTARAYVQNKGVSFPLAEWTAFKALLSDVIRDVNRSSSDNPYQVRVNRTDASSDARDDVSALFQAIIDNDYENLDVQAYPVDANILYANRHFLRAEMVAELGSTIAPEVDSLVDSVVADLRAGGYVNTKTKAERGYFSDLKSSDIDSLRDLIHDVLKQTYLPSSSLNQSSPTLNPQVWLFDPRFVTSVAEALIVGCSSRLTYSARMFPDLAINHEGGYANAARALRANRTFIVNEVIAWVNSTNSGYSFVNLFALFGQTWTWYVSQLERFVNALANDLEQGRFGHTLGFLQQHDHYLSELGPAFDAQSESGRILEQIIPVLHAVLANLTYAPLAQYSENSPSPRVMDETFSYSDDPLYYPGKDPDYNRIDFFHVMERTYLYGLRFKDLQAPGYCVSFPASLVKPRVDHDDHGSVIPSNKASWDEYKANPTPFPTVFSYDYRQEVGPNFPVDAKSNPGGYFDAALELEKALVEPVIDSKTLRDHVMEYVDSSGIFSPLVNPDPLRDQKRTLCRRDVGLLVDAVVYDLRFGGYMESSRAVVAYYIHAKSILPKTTVNPTKGSVEVLRDRTKELFLNLQNSTDDVVEKAVWGAAIVRANALWNGIITSLDSPTDPETGEKTWIPEVVVDSPDNPTGTRIQSIQITNPGSGYNPNSNITYAVTLKHVDETGTELNYPSGSGEEAVLGTPVVNAEGQIVRIDVNFKGRGYDKTVVVVIQSPSTGVTAEARAIMEEDICELEVVGLDDKGRILVNYKKDSGGRELRGSGYNETPFISIPPPRSKRPFVTASPYVQNCSNMSGPWDQMGEKVPVFHPLPYDVKDIYNSDGGRDRGKGKRWVDEEGSGGGIRIDGNVLLSNSPLRSFVVDAFTQVNQGGIGFLLINRAYAQFVSTFGTFCTTHFKALGGSFANASNSVTDFGREGILARGFWRRPYLQTRLVTPPLAAQLFQDDLNEVAFSLGGGVFLKDEGYFSEILNVSRNFDGGEGYPENAVVTVEIDPPGPVSGRRTARVTGFDPILTSIDEQSAPRVKVTMSGGSAIQNGSVRELTVAQTGTPLLSGAGYRTPPAVTITGGNPIRGASTQSELTGISFFTVRVAQGTRITPQFMSMARVRGQFCLVNSVEPATDASGEVVEGLYHIRTTPPPDFALLDDEIDFFQVSYITTSSHAMEYCGSGVTYNALPEYGGVPDREKEVVEVAPGRVFYTKSDQLGNFDAGEAFRVDQLTGSITIDARNLDLSSINSLGPFIRDGRRVGVRMQEISDDPNMRSSLQVPDSETVPTQTAVVNYVFPRAVPRVDPQDDRKVLISNFRSSSVQKYGWEQLTAADIGLERAEIVTDVSQELYVEGEANVYGNLFADQFQITAPSADIPLRTGGMSFSVNPQEQLVIRYKTPGGVIKTKTMDWD